MITSVKRHTFTASLRYERHVSEEFETFVSRLVSYCRSFEQYDENSCQLYYRIMYKLQDDKQGRITRAYSDEAIFHLWVCMHQHILRNWELNIRLAL